MGRRSRGLFIVAGGAALALILLVFLMPSGPTHVEQTAIPIPEAPADKVLVAKKFITEGTLLLPDDMAWAPWPKDIIPQAAIINRFRPSAIAELTGFRARSSFAQNEIIQESKLVSKDGGGWVASILPDGQRLVTFSVTVHSASGGFLQPKDKVDIVMIPRADEASAVAVLLPAVYVFAINGFTDPTALAAANQGATNIPPRLLTVQVSLEEANMLLEIEKFRTLNFNLRPLKEEGGTAANIDDTRTIPLMIMKFDNLTRVQ